MLPIAELMSIFEGYVGMFMAFSVRDPLIHNTADLTKVKDNFFLSQLVTILVSEFVFFANLSPSSFKNLSVSGLNPPYDEKINGVKEPCSTSITLLLYDLFDSLSLP